MTAAVLLAFLAAAALWLNGYTVGVRGPAPVDLRLPGLTDTATTTPPDHDRPAWLPHPHPFASGRFVAWRDPAVRRLDASLAQWRADTTTIRREAGDRGVA